MHLKSFEDFLNTLTEDEIASIVDECKEPLEAVQNDSSGEAQFGNQIAAISLFTSIGLLRRYHEWLSEQL